MSDKQIVNKPKRKAPKTAFKPGKSGNPNGRPKKGLAMTDILIDIGNTEKDNKQRKTIILEKAYAMAEGGDLNAIKFIVERLEGKPFQTQNIKINETDSPYAQFKKELADEVKRLEAKN